MKTILMLFAVLCAALAGAEPNKITVLEATGKITENTWTTLTVEAKPQKWAKLCASYDILWMGDDGVTGPLLTVNGITQLVPVSGNDHYWLTSLLKMPTEPEEIKIELHTKDGRKWRAKWEEVK